MEDFPKSLKDKTHLIARNKLLKKEHILPLTNFVENMRLEQGNDKYIPYFDPLDGGVNAKCLFVLEAPGPKTKDSGFISRNNNDETAKNFFEFNMTAGIHRKITITWNIIPWYIGTEKIIRAANSSDIKSGLPYLYQLIKLLPKLQIIVLIGRKAQRITEELKKNYNNIEIFHCFHPSPLVVNRKPENKHEIINQLKQVSRAIDLLN